MKITLKAFAAVKDIINAEELTLEVPGDTTVKSLLSILADQYPPVEKLCDILLIAINESYADRDAVIQEGDTVALFPPVSGG